jgi:tetratricopeptide (TPR) repeat protein
VPDTQLDATNAKAYFRMGQALVAVKEYEEAIKVRQQANPSPPSCPSLLNFTALVLTLVSHAPPHPPATLTSMMIMTLH